MPSPSDLPSVIEGRVVHRTSNALQITFHDGPGDPFAVGVQGAGDGRGRKLGVLLGFKNGGTGTHVVTSADGTVLSVASRDAAPTLLARGDGSPVASVERGDTSTALLADGSTCLRFAPDGDEAKTPERFRLVVDDPSGGALGRLEVIRRAEGWTAAGAIDAVATEYVWWDRAGQPLPVPVLGTRLTLTRPPTAVERDVLVGACVDMAIGLRPYVAAMR